MQHLSWNNFNSVYTQYTNRDETVGSGTGETAADGLRIGIHGNNNPDMNGNALIYNQENRHLLFSTNANTNTLNFNNGTTLERMRITSVTTPTNLAGGGYGVYNPDGLSNNITRVAISHNPNTPVTRPLSLLHLGYNTSTILGQPSTNGWRDWMDIGTYTTNGYDNVYVGLKRENSGFFGNEKFDAIISWGDNGNNNPSTGPDHLRFIFTERNDGSVAGDFPATSNNGLEVARFSPEKASTIPLIDSLNFGMMGIGYFSPSGTQGPGTPDYIDAKLDIDGDLRIRQVIEDTTLLQVLVIDSNDHNRVYWRDINSFTGNGTVTADNGLSIDPLNPNNVQLVNDVGLTTVEDMATK